MYNNQCVKLLISLFLMCVFLLIFTEVKATVKQDNQTLIGRSYYSYDALPGLSSAVAPESYRVVKHAAKAKIDFTSYKDIKSLFTSFAGTFSVGGSFSRVSGELQNRLAKENKETDFSFSMSFLYNYQRDISMAPIRNVKNPAMIESAKKLFNSKDQVHLPEFVARYGDKFISSYPIGMAVILNARFNFHSIAKKKEIESKLKLEGMPTLANLGVELHKAVGTNSSLGNITITAEQIGGDPSQLLKILPEADLFNFVDAPEISSFISNILAYVKSAEFTDQITDANLAIFLPVTTTNYTQLSNVDPKVTIPSDYFLGKQILEARKIIKDNKAYLDDRLSRHGISVSRFVHNNLRDNLSIYSDNKLRSAIIYYDKLTYFYYSSKKTGDKNYYRDCFTPGNEASDCIEAKNILNTYLQQSGMTQEGIDRIIKNYGFSINIDSTLIAYPVSSLDESKIWIKDNNPNKTDTKTINKIVRFSNEPTYVQKYVVSNRNNKLIGNFFVGVPENNINKKEFPTDAAWSLYSLISGGGSLSNFLLSWQTGNSTSGLVVVIDKKRVRKVYQGFVPLISNENNIFSAEKLYRLIKETGHNAGTEKEKRNLPPRILSGDFKSAFAFDNSLQDNETIGSNGTYCKYVGFGALRGYLLDLTTGMQSSGLVHSDVCVDARPGDALVYYELSGLSEKIRLVYTIVGYNLDKTEYDNSRLQPDAKYGMIVSPVIGRINLPSSI